MDSVNVTPQCNALATYRRSSSVRRADCNVTGTMLHYTRLNYSLRCCDQLPSCTLTVWTRAGNASKCFPCDALHSVDYAGL